MRLLLLLTLLGCGDEDACEDVVVSAGCADECCVFQTRIGTGPAPACEPICPEGTRLIDRCAPAPECTDGGGAR